MTANVSGPAARTLNAWNIAKSFPPSESDSVREEDKREFQKLAEGTGGGYISTADDVRRP